MAPASKSKFKLSFDSVRKVNQTLAAEIQAFVGRDDKQENGDSLEELDADRQESLKQLLRKLYTSICDFHAYKGSAATPDKKIIAAWASFLEPIAVLGRLRPHGPLLAARMLLYLTRAFIRANQLPHTLPAADSSVKPLALRGNLVIALDDALLGHLKTLWTRSRGRESFSWVFSDYPVRKMHKCDNCVSDDLKRNPANASQPSGVDWDVWSAQQEAERFRAACVTTPADLTPANGIHPARTWKRPEGDTSHYPQDPSATSWMYDHWDINVDRPRLLMFQKIGSEGPIREEYSYSIKDEDTRTSDWRSRPALRRSRQFILDTQKVRVLRERRRLATTALAKGGLPPELTSEVWRYAEPVPEEPYLDRLDLPSTYQPFADFGGASGAGDKAKCPECARRSSSTADKNAKRTCPLKAIVFWNLPLRAFHTLHETTVPNRWRLCRHAPCTGHHDDASAQDWILPPQQLEAHLLQILRAQTSDPDMTLESAGLGPHDPIELPTEEEDNDRKRRLYERDYSNAERQDAIDEAQWVGLDGLLGVMRHDRTLLGRHHSGQTTTGPSWIFGRTRQEEARVRSTFRQMSLE